MENTRPILYGVADYAMMRKKNGWFIDRTAKIRDLEATAYAVFLRPRRFGKSFLVSMLQYYYAFTPGPNPVFTKHAITYNEGIGAGMNIVPVDIDGDGDVDLVTTGKWGGPVIFENMARSR